MDGLEINTIGMNLIANTGIQIFSLPLEIDFNDNFKMYFYEWFSLTEKKLTLELAHCFSSEDVWVKKRDLLSLGYMKNGIVIGKWEDICDDFQASDKKTIEIADTPEESGCFQMSLNKIKWEKFQNVWLPFPLFKLYGDNTEYGPTNWCRIKLIPRGSDNNKLCFDMIVAIDTRTCFEQEDFEGEGYMEMPVFTSTYEKSMDFGACTNEFQIVDYCVKGVGDRNMARSMNWVDDYILKIFHGVDSLTDLKIKRPRLAYLANYITMVNYICKKNVMPKIKLFSNKNVDYENVDFVIDVGNSRTCAVLFDGGDFTKVEPLALQDYTDFVSNGQLKKYSDSFDMRLVFRHVDFGGKFIKNSRQFIYPSMVRLGHESNVLLHRMKENENGEDIVSTFSSPKRYLWDVKRHTKEWEFAVMEGEKKKPLWIEGISEQLNPDGSLNVDGSGGKINEYSRKTLMTFAFLEMLVQANTQINSYEYRHKWGSESKPRRISKIIVTCPTAMSRLEQKSLRKCAMDALAMIERFTKGNYMKDFNIKLFGNYVKVIPSIKDNEEQDGTVTKSWIFDEATCSQFVYVYAEIAKRYLNNCKEYFDFYGKVRNDLGDYNKKSLTIGSVDIGAGTTDVMIASYKYDDSYQCILTPVPRFWESFYSAGDDLIKEMIRQLIIEGEYASIQNHIIKTGRRTEVTKLLSDFFGVDDARKSIQDRYIRNEFNLQVSMPIVSYYLDLQNHYKTEKMSLTYDDIFHDNMPSENVLEHFNKHFGFPLSSVVWNYDRNIIDKIIERTFDKLVGKISVILSYYDCDVVLLSGRPTSLKSLSNLFLKYFAITPNRLVTLNEYRVGRWYPFHDADGYFNNAKSVVAIGAMIGYQASVNGDMNGFSLNLSELGKNLIPTTDFMAKFNPHSGTCGNPFISPENNQATLMIDSLPYRIGCKQLDDVSYPSRPFYVMDFNYEKIEKQIKKKLGQKDGDYYDSKTALDNKIVELKSKMPFKARINRPSYVEDKELIVLDSITDINNEDIDIDNFSLQVQSLSESENYWLDTGEFTNLNITHI